MNVRTLLVGLGAAGVGLAGVLVVRPDLAAGLRLPRLAVVIVGAVALVEGLRAVESRRNAAFEQAAPADVEGGVETPTPGDDVDELLGAAARAPRPVDEDRLRRRLRAAAIAAVASRDGISRSAAAKRVDDGTWTDDPVAAGYLAEPETLPRRWRVRKLVRPRSTTRRCIARSLDAIEEVRET